MSKEIKDYLHLYLNSVDVIIDTVREDFKAHFGHAPGHKTQFGPILYAVILEGGVTVKPILRDLSDMTEEEVKTWLHYRYNSVKEFDEVQKDKSGYWYNFKTESNLTEKVKKLKRRFIFWQQISDESYPENFKFLLSKGFDLFGLIPAKLAINAKDLKQ